MKGSLPYKGIEAYGKAWWRAAIRVNGQRIRSSVYFRTQEQAARHYDDLALHYFGEYAYLNFGGK